MDILSMLMSMQVIVQKFQRQNVLENVRDEIVQAQLPIVQIIIFYKFIFENFECTASSA